MRKPSLIFVTALLLMLFSVTFLASASYSVGEAEFDIPIEFSVFYGEGELSETEAYRFLAPDNSVELSCYYIKNTEGISFAFMELTDAVDYFFDNISAINGDDFTVESVQLYYWNADNTGIMAEGYIEKSGESIPIYVYAFSTADNVYGFEFKIYNASGTEFVNEFLNSLYFTDQNTSIDNEGTGSIDGFFEALSVIVILAVSIAAVALKSIKKVPGKEKTAENKPVKIHNPSEKQGSGKILKNKFKLNGKNINIFNESFTTGKADDNFALDELNRERKERERKFNKGE
jgi:hypothetical protein